MITDKNNKPMKTSKQIAAEEKKAANKIKRKNYAAYLIAGIVVALLIAAGVMFLAEKLTAFIDTEFIQPRVSYQAKLNQ